MAENSNFSNKSKLMEMQIGILPLPVYIVLAAIILLAAYVGKLPVDMIGGFALMMIIGMLLGDLGLKIPILKDIGGPAILSIFIPSILVFYNVFNKNTIDAITAVTKTSNFLYFYIACLVTGSILGMVRKTLISGFVRLFVPLIVGTVASCIVGTLVGTVLGLGTFESFFYIVVPIISGGIGEGILPLSIGYSAVLGKSPEDFIGMLVPAAMLGNVVAIMSAGFLHRLGIKKPHLTGNGTLVKSGDEIFEERKELPFNVSLMGAGMVLACSAFILGGLLNTIIPIPAPIIMIISVALIKLLAILPEKMEVGAYQFYRFVATNLTWALLVGVGVLYTPWDKVLQAISPAYIITVVATVLTMITSGFFVGKYMKMYPIEAAIVTGTHSGLGGTGDVAILSAANRMELMPFAQIATRLGGAGVVVLAVIIMRLMA